MAHKDMYGRRTYSVKGLDEAIEASGMTREEVERQYGAPLPTRVSTVEIGRLRHILGDTGIGGYITRPIRISRELTGPLLALNLSLQNIYCALLILRRT